MKNKKIGEIGEAVAGKYLKNKGFRIVSCNYRIYTGEIDIICIKKRKVHFIEVKTAEYKNKLSLENAVSYGTTNISERIDNRKLQNIKTAIGSYISDMKYRGTYQIDAVFVHIVPYETYAAVEYIENIEEE